MDINDASNHVLYFGKYKGRTIDEIGQTADGLRYLDWFRGQEWSQKHHNLRQAVETYLNHPPIARALDESIGDNE